MLSEHLNTLFQNMKTEVLVQATPSDGRLMSCQQTLKTTMLKQLSLITMR